MAVNLDEIFGKTQQQQQQPKATFDLDAIFKTTQGKQAAKQMQAQAPQSPGLFQGSKAGAGIAKSKIPSFGEDPAGYLIPPQAEYTMEEIAKPSVNALKSTFTGKMDGKKIDPSQRFWNLFQGTVGTVVSPVLGLTEVAFKPLGEMAMEGAGKISELGQEYGAGVEERTKQIFGEGNVQKFQETVGEDVAKKLYEPAVKMKEMYDAMPEEGKLAAKTALGVLELIGLKPAIKETGQVLGRTEQTLRLGGEKINPIFKKIQKTAKEKSALRAAERDAGLLAKETREALKIEPGVKEIIKKPGEIIEPTSLQERIMPKLDKGELKFAKQQRRLKESPFFEKLFGKKFIVEPDKNVVKSSKIIKEKIPNYESLNDFELHEAIEDQVTNIKNEFKPELAKIKVSPDDLREGKGRELFDTFAQIKNTIDKEIIATDGGTRIQKKFQAFVGDLMEKVKNGEATLDDFYEARIDYDRSISKNVKDALPGTDAYNKKELWMDRRDILNEAIYDLANIKANNLNVKTAVDDMHKLLIASKNMTNKLDLKAIRESVGPLNKENLKKWAIRLGLTYGGIKGAEAIF